VQILRHDRVSQLQHLSPNSCVYVVVKGLEIEEHVSIPLERKGVPRYPPRVLSTHFGLSESILALRRELRPVRRMGRHAGSRAGSLGALAEAEGHGKFWF
jgi:hypothetical protein